MLNDSSRWMIQRLSRDGFEWVWDPRAGILSLLAPSAGSAAPRSVLALRLTAGHSVAAQLERELRDNGLCSRLSESLVLATEGPPPDEEGLRNALGELAFGLLCRSLRKGEAMFSSAVPVEGWGLRRQRYLTSRGRQLDGARATLRDAAESALRWLRADSHLTAWRYAYADDIEHQRRYQLMAGAQELLSARETGASNDLVGESLAGDHGRPAYWWTTRCLHDFALKWCQEEPASPVARAALMESRARYLALVREEPRRATFESFLRRTGSSAEWEVMRVLHDAPQAVVGTAKKPRAAAPDELLRELCAGWMLRRYAVCRALRLVGSTLTGRDLVWGAVAVGLLVTAIGLFRCEVELPSQVFLQLLTLGFLTFTPKLFRLLLPRALFGSLLAWLTIVISQAVSMFPFAGPPEIIGTAIPVAAASLHPVPVGGETPAGFQQVCHRALAEPFQGGWQGWSEDLRLRRRHFRSFRDWTARQGFLALLLACAVFAYVFVGIELMGRVPSASLLRPAAVVFIMVAGSLFWGMMFSPFLRVLVEGDASDQSCGCIWTILWLGSFGAVVFGILVQLLWEDHSLTDQMTGAIT